MLAKKFFDIVYNTLPVNNSPMNGELTDLDSISFKENSHSCLSSKTVISASVSNEKRSPLKSIIFLGLTVKKSITF